MRKLLSTLLLAAALLPVGIAGAQYRERFGTRGPEMRGYDRELLNRVRLDADRASRNMRVVAPFEARRFADFRRSLFEFRRSWDRGHFDRPAFDHAMGDLRAILDLERLRPRDRDRLLSDMSQLRDLRERYERGFPYR